MAIITEMKKETMEQEVVVKKTIVCNRCGKQAVMIGQGSIDHKAQELLDITIDNQHE